MVASTAPKEEIERLLAAKVGAPPSIERLIAAEGLFPGWAALLSDRLVHFEQRLGRLELKGEYPYAGAGAPELTPGFGGYDLAVQVGDRTLRLSRLALDDANEVSRRFGGGAAPAEPELVVPGVTTAGAPAATAAPAPPPDEPVIIRRAYAAKAAAPAAPARQRPTPFRFTWGRITIAASAVAAATLVTDFFLVTLQRDFSGFPRFGMVAGWIVFAVLGPLALGRAQQIGPAVLWGGAAGVASLLAGFFLPVVGGPSLIFGAVAIVGDALISIGYFKARFSQRSWKAAAVVGGGFGLARMVVLSPVLALVVVPIVSSLPGTILTQPISIQGYVVVGAILSGLFWWVQYAVELAPNSPLREPA